MAFTDYSGLPEAERVTARIACSRDPSLEHELRMILPALSSRTQAAFWRAFVRRAGDARPPAGAVLEALVDAARDRD